MNKNKLNKIAAIEKAICEKYGEEAIQNPGLTGQKKKKKTTLSN